MKFIIVNLNVIRNNQSGFLVKLPTIIILSELSSKSDKKSEKSEILSEGRADNTNKIFQLGWTRPLVD